MVKQLLRIVAILSLIYSAAYSADKDSLKQALLPLPLTCYPDILEKPAYDIPLCLFDGCNVLQSQLVDKRLSVAQRTAYTRAIAAVQKTFHYGQDVVGTITYNKSTPFNKSLSFAVSQIWKALAGSIEHEPFSIPPMTCQKIVRLRDGLNLLVRSVDPTNKVISPERKRQELRTYTGVTSPVKVNLFANIPQSSLGMASALKIVCNLQITVDASEQQRLDAEQSSGSSSTSEPTRSQRKSKKLTMDDFVQSDVPLEIEAFSGSSSSSSSSLLSTRPAAKRTQRSVPARKKKPLLVQGQTFMTSFLQPGDNVIDLELDLETESSPSKRSRQA